MSPESEDDQPAYMGTFCERLRMAMRVAAVTNAEMARRSGLSPDNVSHFARGERMPSVPNLAKLLRALPGVDARWLVTGDEA